MGREWLLKLKKRARFPFLNANIVNEKNENLFDRYSIQQIGNLKIGIFSVLDSSLPLPKGLGMLDTISASRGAIKDLRRKNVDFIIALTHQGLQKDRNWAGKVSGIDLIVGGHDSSHLSSLQKVGETLIVNGYELGKYTGVVDFMFRKGVHQFAPSSDLSEVGTVSRYHHRLVPLDSVFKNGDPDVFKEVQEFKKRLQALVLESAPLEAKELPLSHRVEFATYRRCLECHRKQYDVWKLSKHASAMIPLYIRNQHLNPECIQCHSVGFRQPGGFNDITRPFVMPDGMPEKMKEAMEGFLQKLQKKNYKGIMIDLREHPEFDRWIRSQYVKAIEKEKWKKDFLGIQCENCHQARGLKDAEGNPIPHFSEASFPKKVVVQTCLQCHTSQQSPHFDFLKDRHIKGEKGAKPPFQCVLGVF